VLARPQRRHARQHASLIATIVLCAAGSAHADEDSIPGVHDFSVGVEAGRVADPEVLDARATIALAVAIHEKLGLARTGPAWGWDLALGSTSSGGFLYGTAIRVGVGLQLGARGQFAITTGAGFSGITGGRLGFAWTIPTDAYVAVPLRFGGLRVAAGATGTWLYTEDARQHGAAHVPPFDEATARIGVLRPTWGVHVFVSELRDTHIWGISVGVADSALENP
jgi:hypothetical protein